MAFSGLSAALAGTQGRPLVAAACRRSVAPSSWPERAACRGLPVNQIKRSPATKDCDATWRCRQGSSTWIRARCWSAFSGRAARRTSRLAGRAAAAGCLPVPRPPSASPAGVGKYLASSCSGLDRASQLTHDLKIILQLPILPPRVTIVFIIALIVRNMMNQLVQ